MTTITERMIKLGTLEATEAVGDVYQDGTDFFYQVKGWTIVGDDETHYLSESERFSSLDSLIASVPHGVHFQLEGAFETLEERVVRNREEMLKFAKISEEMEIVDAERTREYGTIDFLEICRIEKERKMVGENRS